MLPGYRDDARALHDALTRMVAMFDILPALKAGVSRAKTDDLYTGGGVDVVTHD